MTKLPGFGAGNAPFAEEVSFLDVAAVEVYGGVEDGDSVVPFVGNIGEIPAVDDDGGGPAETPVGVAFAAEATDFVFVDGYLVDAEDPVAVVAAVDHVDVVVGVESDVDGVAEDGEVAEGVAVAEFTAAGGCWLQGFFSCLRVGGVGCSGESPPS